MGVFFDAFHKGKATWKTLSVSTEEAAAARIDGKPVPGLAKASWIEAKRQEWGEDSPFFRVRVRGLFPVGEDGKIFSLDKITAAQQRWHETPAEGRLFIGLDPAGASGSGDETAIALRRGLKIVEVFVRRGLTAEGHLEELLGTISTYRYGREVPVVVVDSDGAVGAEVYGALKGHAEAHPASFELVRMRGSDAPSRQAQIYDRQRDLLTGNLEQWMREGLAIPEDAKLETEMHVFEWIQVTKGRVKATPKDKIRKEIGRSPDRYDAVALACWEPLSLKEDIDEQPDSVRAAAGRDTDDDDAGSTLDPYAGASAWGRR